MLSNSSPSTFMNRYQIHVSGAGFSHYTGGAGFSHYTWVWVMLRLWSTVIWGLSIRAWPLTKTYLRKYGYRIPRRVSGPCDISSFDHACIQSYRTGIPTQFMKKRNWKSVSLCVTSLPRTLMIVFQSYLDVRSLQETVSM